MKNVKNSSKITVGGFFIVVMAIMAVFFFISLLRLLKEQAVNIATGLTTQERYSNQRPYIQPAKDEDNGMFADDISNHRMH